MAPVPEELKEIFKMGRDEIEREFAPHFFQYFEFGFGSPDTFLEALSEHYKYIFDIIQAKDRKLLDVGCGFGLLSIQLAVYGAQMVSAVDTNEEKIDVFRKILHRFTPPLNNIEIKLGDALNFEYEDNYFDGVVAIEVVSHVRDADILIREMRRVLRKGGICFILDGNNALDIRAYHKRRRFWRSWEYGPIPESGCRGTDKPLPWSLIRREMIQGKYPYLDIKALDLLAKETAGMYGSQVFQAVDEYLREGRVFNKPSFKFRNPETGEYNEFEFNPFHLKRRLEENGFSARILKPSFQKSSSPSARAFLHNLAIDGIKLFHPISLIIAPRFEILARKKE